MAHHTAYLAFDDVYWAYLVDDLVLARTFDLVSGLLPLRLVHCIVVLLQSRPKEDRPVYSS